MAVPVLMPRQGQSVESCILGQWYKQVGETISEGDILFSYETDKASFEEEAKADGVLLATFFEEGDEIPVLANVAVIGSEGESFEEFKPGNESASEKPEPEEKEEAPKIIEFDVEDESPGKRIRISPLARNMAESLGLAISRIKGSGPHGRIIARDVEQASKQDLSQASTEIISEAVPKAVPPAKPVPLPVIESGEHQFQIFENLLQLPCISRFKIQPSLHTI